MQSAAFRAEMNGSKPCSENTALKARGEDSLIQNRVQEPRRAGGSNNAVSAGTAMAAQHQAPMAKPVKVLQQWEIAALKKQREEYREFEK